MSYPSDLKYKDSHEWVRLEGDVATIGLSWFAQDSLGDVVHVELPELGASVTSGESVAEVESVKAVSDVYSPVSGEITAVNEELDGTEERVNDDPYGQGWLFQVRVSNPSEIDTLMSAAEYESHCD